MAPDRERLVYVFGEETLDALDDYDLDDESDLREVIERFLPFGDDFPEHGARLAIRQIAVTQLLAAHQAPTGNDRLDVRPTSHRGCTRRSRRGR